MEGPRPWGTALRITVSPVPGKYALPAAKGLAESRFTGRRCGRLRRPSEQPSKRTHLPGLPGLPAERRLPAGPGLACTLQRG